MKNVAIMRDAEGNTKGFAFVSMEKHEDAEKACNALDGQPSPNGGNKSRFMVDIPFS